MEEAREEGRDVGRDVGREEGAEREWEKEVVTGAKREAREVRAVRAVRAVWEEAVDDVVAGAVDVVAENGAKEGEEERGRVESGLDLKTESLTRLARRRREDAERAAWRSAWARGGSWDVGWSSCCVAGEVSGSRLRGRKVDLERWAGMFEVSGVERERRGGDGVLIWAFERERLRALGRMGDANAMSAHSLSASGSEEVGGAETEVFRAEESVAAALARMARGSLGEMVAKDEVVVVVAVAVVVDGEGVREGRDATGQARGGTGGAKMETGVGRGVRRASSEGAEEEGGGATITTLGFRDSAGVRDGRRIFCKLCDFAEGEGANADLGGLMEAPEEDPKEGLEDWDLAGKRVASGRLVFPVQSASGIRSEAAEGLGEEALSGEEEEGTTNKSFGVVFGSEQTFASLRASGAGREWAAPGSWFSLFAGCEEDRLGASWAEDLVRASLDGREIAEII